MAIIGSDLHPRYQQIAMLDAGTGRGFVEVAANFPDECRYLLEMLGQVYGHDDKDVS